jgi:hypothetical protein
MFLSDGDFLCNLEINVDESCNNTGPPDQCKDPMSNCTEVVSGDYKCSCNPGYYNNGGTCIIRVFVCYTVIWCLFKDVTCYLFIIINQHMTTITFI